MTLLPQQDCCHDICHLCMFQLIQPHWIECTYYGNTPNQKQLVPQGFTSKKGKDIPTPFDMTTLQYYPTRDETNFIEDSIKWLQQSHILFVVSENL